MTTPISKTIADLVTHQKWRRDEIEEMMHPPLIGEAIDAAIAHMKSIPALEARIAELENQLQIKRKIK